MYGLRYTNPRLSGYVYRRKKRCGKPNCRCAKGDKYRHTAYYLQYRELVNGEWKPLSEYVPKSKVRALRARIKRAKQRDRETREKVRASLKLIARSAKRLKRKPSNELSDNLATLRAFDAALEKMSGAKFMAQLTPCELAKCMAAMFDIVLASDHFARAITESYRKKCHRLVAS